MKTIIKLDKNIINTNNKYILALSGGRDSMALFDLLLKNNIPFVIAHINHQKRKQSIIEENYIIDLAKKYNIPCEVIKYTYQGKDNFQADAHNFRYNFFYDLAIKYNAKYILTAHHADDLAETIMLRLISGSNLYGYGGISKLTPYKDKFIYRALLNYSREDINNYILENNIFYFEDESNLEDDYLRNRIRHTIIPLFKEENPNFLNSINNYSTMLKESFSFIRENTINYLNNNLVLDLNTFNNLHIALKKDIINYLFEQNNIKASNNLIEDIFRIINNPKPQIDYNISKDTLFVKRYDRAYIKDNTKIETTTLKLDLENTGIFSESYKFTLTEKLINPNAKHLKLWYNDGDLPIVIRTRLPGDYLSFNFGKKKLKDYFIDKKIIKEKRDSYPIITNSIGDIIAIYDILNLSKGSKFCYLICEV